MSFVARAQQFVSNPNISSSRQNEMVETVRFLLQQSTPINTDRIVAHLTNRHYTINREQWEQEVLGPLRDFGIFIGSSNRGIFIVRSREDAIDTYRFYAKRIIAESERLGILANLIRVAGWNLPNIQIE